MSKLPDMNLDTRDDRKSPNFMPANPGIRGISGTKISAKMIIYRGSNRSITGKMIPFPNQSAIIIKLNVIFAVYIKRVPKQFTGNIRVETIRRNYVCEFELIKIHGSVKKSRLARDGKIKNTSIIPNVHKVRVTGKEFEIRADHLCCVTNGFIKPGGVREIIRIPKMPSSIFVFENVNSNFILRVKNS